jgi:hypothetical protein
MFKSNATLWAVVVAICAFAVPSSATAASWGVIGTAHTLTSTNLTSTAHLSGGGTIGETCATTQLQADVMDASIVTVTNASFTNCTGTGVGGDCLVTKRAVDLPWRITISTFALHGHIETIYENKASGPPCPTPITMTWKGLTRPGTWNAALHQISYANATGWTATSALGNLPATVTGTIRDVAQTLTAS